MLAAVMTGCVIFKSVSSSQVGFIGNVKITTTACASDTNSNNSGYSPADSACQGASHGGNVDADAANRTSGTPSFNHVTTGLKTNTTTTDPSFSYTVNSGGDKLLLVKIVESATTDNIAGVTYGGTALTALSEYAPGASRWANHVFYMKNPPQGTANVVVDITAGVKLTVGMEQYNGVNQTTPFGTVATNSSTSSTGPTVNVSSTSGELVTDSLGVVSDTSIPTVTTSSPLTEMYEINTGATTTDVVGVGSRATATGGTTTMPHTLSAARGWSTVGFAIKPSQIGVQLKLAYRIPTNSTAPSTIVSTDPSGGSAITFNQNAGYASQLTSLVPPGSGKKWVGYLSTTQSYTTSGYQYFTVAPEFTLPQEADGSPFQTPFNYRVVVGYRDVDDSTSGSDSSRAVTCGSDAFALYDDGSSVNGMQGACIDDPNSTTVSSDLSQSTRDLGIVAGSPQAADAGAQATVPFSVEWSGGGCFCVWDLAATTNIPGATATPSLAQYNPNSDDNPQAVDVDVDIPPGTTPGTYNVTLTGTFPAGDGSVRQRTNTVTVGEAFGLSPAPTLPALGAITLNAQAQTKNATMSNFGVIDSPGTSDQGWNVTVVGDTSGGKPGKFAQYCPGPGNCGSDPPGYVSGGYQLLANSLNLNSTGASWSGGTGTTPSFQCNSGNCPIDAATNTKIASAPNGGGTALWSATGFSSSSLALSTPSTLRALPTSEVYHLHAVWTLNSGP